MIMCMCFLNLSLRSEEPCSIGHIHLSPPDCDILISVHISLCSPLLKLLEVAKEQELAKNRKVASIDRTVSADENGINSI